jgi:hypothetical protein
VNNSSKAQFEVHLVVYAKNKCAGISHSPIDYDLLGGRRVPFSGSHRETEVQQKERENWSSHEAQIEQSPFFGPLLFNQVVFDGECIEASCVK